MAWGLALCRRFMGEQRGCDSHSGATFLAVLSVLLCQWELIKPCVAYCWLSTHFCSCKPHQGCDGACLCWAEAGTTDGDTCQQPATGKDAGLSQDVSVLMGCRVDRTQLGQNQPAGFCWCRHMQTSYFHQHRAALCKGREVQSPRE